MIGSGREGVGKTAKGYACSDGGELLCLLTLYEKGTGGCQRGGVGRRVRRLREIERERGDGVKEPSRGNGQTNVGGGGEGGKHELGNLIPA